MGSLKNSSTNIPFYDVVVKEEAPFVMAEKHGSGKVSFSGMAIDLLKMVSEKAHFSYNVKLTDHDSYGYQDSQGNWQGLISELTGNKADLAVGPIPISETQSNLDTVDYTKPFMSSGINLLIKHPPTSTPRGISLMLEPFAAEVWVMIVLAFIIISLALFLVGRFSPYEWARVSKDKDPRYARTSFGLKNSFLFAASTLSWQGYREAPRSISGRILMCMWFMFTVFVMVAYTACLCAILTTRNDSRPQQVPFTNYDDIIENKQVTLGAMKYGYVYSLLKTKSQPNTLMSRLYTYIDDSQEWIQKKDEGIQRVKDSGGKYAMLVESIKAQYVTATNCDLITYGDLLSTVGYGFAVKGPALKDRINMALLELIEDGTLHILLTKHFYSRNVCPDYDKSKLIPQKGGSSPYSMASSMDMRDMAIPFLFFFLGVLGAGGALAAELYYRKRFANKKDPDDKARQPLNTEAGASKAPKTSPPPPPIYKVCNKLQDTAKEKEKKSSPEKATPEVKDKDPEKGGIEMVPMDDKVEADRSEEPVKYTEPAEIEVKKLDESPEAKTEVVNEVA